MNLLRLIKIVLIVFILVCCRKQNTGVCTDDIGLYHASPYPIGVAINIDEFNNNATYQTVATRQFNSFTAENIFKASYLHPAPNFFDWQQADDLTNFCIGSNKRLHGHTLIWHQQLPDWITTFEGNYQEWEHIFQTHITTIVKHFKGKVKAWDVVNEAFNEDGTLRNSIWKEKIGNSFIEKAFIYAHEADSDALLFYSDYNLESNPTKRKSVIALLNHLRSRGIQVDGVGMQMHISILYPDVSQLTDALNDFVKNDYKIHLSEFDISVNPLGKDIEPSSELFEKQAETVSKVVLHYNQLPSNYQYGITFWGISDKNSWIMNQFNREDYPLLYDDNYSPKPAYCKLKQLFK